MPIYEYRCECGVQFEKPVKFSDREKPQRCVACDTPAPRLMPTKVNAVFARDVTGPVPQNTGLSAYDAQVDRVIGQSAKQGWDAHEERQESKKEVLRSNPDADPHALAKNPDGSYRVLHESERSVQVRAHTINAHGIKTVLERRMTRSPTLWSRTHSGDR